MFKLNSGKTAVIVTVIVLAVIIIAGFFLFRGGGPEVSDLAQDLPEGLPNLGALPSFSLRDYEGSIVDSADFADKVLVVNSWATWCPFCVDELPDFVAAQEEFGDEVVIISIGRAESLEKSKGFTDDLGVTNGLVFLLDPDDSFYSSIGAFSMPETVFVDKEGNIRIHKRGPMSLDEIREKTQATLDAA